MNSEKSKQEQEDAPKKTMNEQELREKFSYKRNTDLNNIKKKRRNCC